MVKGTLGSSGNLSGYLNVRYFMQPVPALVRSIKQSNNKCRQTEIYTGHTIPVTVEITCNQNSVDDDATNS